MRGRKNLVAAKVTSVLQGQRVSLGRGGRIVAHDASRGMRGGVPSEPHRGGRLVARVWHASAAPGGVAPEFVCQTVGLVGCFALSACHLLGELAATSPTLTVRLDRLVDMTTSLLRHREHATAVSTATGLDPTQSDAARGDIVAIPPMPGIPPLVAEMIRSLYGVDLIVKAVSLSLGSSYQFRLRRVSWEAATKRRRARPLTILTSVPSPFSLFPPAGG